MTIKIEKEIPIPDARTSAGRPSNYPFREMRKGESFLWEGEGAPIQAAHTFKKNNEGYEFTGRTLDKEKKIYRVWCLRSPLRGRPAKRI